ncbi:MAG: ABC transporter permease [Spirochaetales bacterium]|uniref:ABC transporter permease n=1 Tax=Candidatus Thalassospirochaeta sargassi TaxID=3119039 RepID=A0AAJ1IAN0_9SPIO|nr:ABC transporter permease [Spirochaetales bacterium]
MGFLLFILKRFVRLLATVLIISTIIFFVIRVIPGDPALVIAGIDASDEEIASVRAKLGTDKPIGVQYIEWLGDIVRLDFGDSMISGEPVRELIFERFPLTLSLALMGISLGILIAIPLGVVSAVRRWSAWDYFGMLFSQVGMAIPSFWLAILLLLIFAVRFPLFPLFGLGSFRHLVLPALSLGFVRAAVILRLTRASMVEELSKEYVITARAKGLTETMVKYKHALRNALIPVVTITGIQFGYMLGGAIIIEQVFSLPGLGRLFLYGIYQRDFTLVQGGVVFIAVVFSLVNFLVDVLYSVINPKIRIS